MNLRFFFYCCDKNTMNKAASKIKHLIGAHDSGGRVHDCDSRKHGTGAVAESLQQ